MLFRRWLTQHLYLRVLLAMITSIAVVLIAVTAVTIKLSQDRLKDDMLARGEHYSHILTHAASVYVAQQDAHQLLLTAKAATESDQVQLAAFFSRGGELLAAAAAPTASPAMRSSFGDLPSQAQAQGQMLSHWSNDSLDLIYPIVYQGQLVGSVALRFDTRELTTGIRWEIFHNVLTAVALILAIGIVIGLLLHQLFMVPLRELSDTADQISAGRWAVPAGEERSDEFGRVARSFSRMVSVLQARETQITLFIRTDGGIIEANRAAVAAYGFDREALLTKSIFELEVSGPEHINLSALWRDQVENLVFETLHCRSDGSTFPVEIIARRAVIDGEHIIISDINDITERKQAETALAEERNLLARRVEERTTDLSAANAKLARALLLKDEFLAMMSHELRTPLSSILGITEALDINLYGPITEQQRTALGKITQSGRHLLAILSDILDLARIGAGVEKLNLEPANIPILCQTALQFVESAAAQKRIQLHCMIDNMPVELQADQRRLTQILANLLDNAVKFTPVDGQVGLEATADMARECIRFSVWDTGIGIAETEIERLFEPFTQVDGRLSRAYGGIGLGLTMVRRLVDLHNGSISLESAPGQGSRFTVSLPWSVPTDKVPATAIPTSRLLQVWERAPRVLIADDHELSLGFYTEVLTQQGFLVTSAHTGKEAVANVQQDCPDVMVLDIRMPEMDGPTGIRLIRDTPAGAVVPIIALTALAMPGDRERCLSAGANAYLTKPVSPRTLTETISAVLPQIVAHSELPST